jgi:hypothetical protein
MAYASPANPCWKEQELGIMVSMNNTDEYEGPAIKRLGTVAEMTAASNLMNSDHGGIANDAFSN